MIPRKKCESELHLIHANLILHFLAC